MNLTNDAMLVDLTVTAWSGRRYDREASDHVAAAHDKAVASVKPGKEREMLHVEWLARNQAPRAKSRRRGSASCRESSSPTRWRQSALPQKSGACA